MNKGKFIAIEGINSSGKSSVIKELQKRLNSPRFIFTKEPSDSILGNFIRENSHIYSKESLACLIAADRIHHIENLIRPNILKKRIVISDRYIHSSLVYQRMDGVDLDYIMAVNGDHQIPDLTIYLSIDKEIVKHRRNKQEVNLDRFETLNKLDIEVQYYNDAIKYLLPRKYETVIINCGTKSIIQVANEVEEYIIKLINEK